MSRKGRELTSLAPAHPLRIPTHIGLIMDGNGRWANARGLPRTEGHRIGIRALRNTVEYCIKYGVAYLTVFSFSSENWARPRDEISFIFKLLERFVASDLERLVRAGVKVRISGERNSLDADLKRLIKKVEEATVSGTALELIVAFNYGGKAEIAAAARKIAEDVFADKLDVTRITEQTLSDRLYVPDVPDPDLIIRTGGEKRLSNFLLWQAAYAELVFLDIYWPDFDENAFLSALKEYAGRERRFGAVEAAPL